MKHPILIPFLIINFIISLGKCEQVTNESNFSSYTKTYSPNEKVQLKKLYNKVSKHLTQGIMHEDKYLIRFLRAQNHDVDRAEEMIYKLLKWRNETNMDTILKEDWTAFIRRHPYSIQGNAYDGRSALMTGFGTFDGRTYVLRGKIEQMKRYMISALENAVAHLHVRPNKFGEEIVDGYLLFNMHGFSIRSHACAACIAHWLEFLYIYEHYYPRLAARIIIINTPRIYSGIQEQLRPFTLRHTIKIVQTFDFDKEVWKKELLKLFPESELTTEFGGTAKYEYPYVPDEYFKESNGLIRNN